MFNPRSKTVLFFIFWLNILISTSTLATTYYVDATNGLDNNEGTSETDAWKTIAKVNTSSFKPGDQILFKRGEIWREQLTVSSSGIIGNPITFGAYGNGALPIINGSDTITGWTAESLGLFSVYYTTTSANPNQVFENNLLLDRNISSKESLTVGQWCWDSSKMRVYIRTTGDKSPSNYIMEVPARDYGAKSYLRDNITFSDIHFTKTAIAGLRLANASNLTIKGVLADFNGSQGISIYSDDAETDSDIIVEGVTCSYNGTRGLYLAEYIHDVDIYDSTFDHNGQNPESTYSSGVYIASADQTLYGVTVRNNVAAYNGMKSDNVTPIGDLGWTGYGIWFDTTGSNSGADPNIVRSNTVYGNRSAGIEMENTLGDVVEYNLAYDNLTAGIEVSCSHTDYPSIGVKVYNNTSTRNVMFGLHVQTGGSDKAGISNTIVKNNILVGNLGVNLSAVAGGDNVTDANGIGSGNVYTYNCMGPGPQATNFIEWGRTRFSTYNAWETAYGGKTHSIEADPQFISSSDFHLQENSPCINAGDDVGFTTDIEGKTIFDKTIGAYSNPTSAPSHLAAPKNFIYLNVTY